VPRRQVKARRPANAVVDAIVALGGDLEAVVKLKIPPRTLARWKAKGKIANAKWVFRVADASGVSARRLAGIED
jgi:hypothetical protein